MTEYVQENSWFNKPVLEEEESIHGSYPANRTQGKRAVGGKLFLTSKRLIFIPNVMDSKMGGECWEVAKSEVESLEKIPGKFVLKEIFSGAWRSRLGVNLNRGIKELFVVNSLDKTILELNSLLFKE